MKKNLRILFSLLIVAMLVSCSVFEVEPRGVRERISIDASEDAYLYNSADLYVYSDAHATQKYHVDGATGNTTIAGTLTATGATVLNGGLTMDTNKFTVADTSGNTVIGGTLSVADKITLSGETVFASSEITPANGSTLTISATYYKVNSSAAVTITLGTTGATAGQIVIFYGDDNNTVKFADTNLLSSDGNAIDLGQYDIVMLVYTSASKWALIAKSTNS